MAEEAPAAPPAKAPKKKSTASRTRREGPSLFKLIVTVIAEAKDRRGTSLTAAKKILAAKGVDVVKNNKRINGAVAALVSKGVLIQTKGKGASGSFKIAKKEPKAAAKKTVKKSPVKARKPAAKKPAARKPAAKKPAAKKPAAKKPAAKKSAVKKAVAKKPAAKKAPKKTASKSPKKAPKKPAAKSTPKKVAPKKAAAKKTTPKKTAAKKAKK